MKMANFKHHLFISSCKEGNLSKVKELVEQGVDIHICNDSSIRWAAASGHLEIVKYLVERGADIHNNIDYPLRVAAANGHLEIVKYLVKHGVDIHARDDDSLRWAADNRYLEVVNYLRLVAGNKWKCFNCLVRATCLTLCEGWDKNR